MERNIEHPDLSKMSDTELDHEVKYLRWHIPEILDWCYETVENACTGNRKTDDLPHIKIVSNLKFEMDRLQAIIDEIHFRATSMR